MDNPEKLATQGTQDDEKHNTTRAGHHTQINTHYANKTRALLKVASTNSECHIFYVNKLLIN